MIPRLLLTITALLLAVPAAAQKAERLALTPPMGWNSWNHYACDIDETLIKRTADAIVSSGLRDAGYVYVNLDDCWHGERAADGTIQADPQGFPSGMKALGDYLHERGLKFGIYSDAGEQTCAGRPGSQGYEFQDARQYAAWDVDYVKYDWCNTGTGPALWRTTGDITNCWNCELGHGNRVSHGVLRILDKQVPLRQYSGPDGWNDPDMMEVGNMASAAENRSHFAMWAMLAAPLIMGTDVPGMTAETRAILTNRRVIAIDQDPLGIPAMRWFAFPDDEIWAKPLANERWAIALLNRSEETQTISVDWAHGELKDDLHQRNPEFATRTYAVENAWTGSAEGTTASPLERRVGPRDTLIFTLDPRP